MLNRFKPHLASFTFPAGSVFYLLLCAGFLLRLYYCFQGTPYTTDLVRNIGYGKAFPRYGFQLYDMTPFDLSPWPCQFLWHNHHYTYPPVTLLLFALISSIHTSMVFGKIVLTLFDALAAWMIGKTGNDRWLVILYWLNPISVWYTSREGQFEGFVVFWTVLAIWAMQNKKTWAYGIFGIAIQTKLFPILLAPLFLLKMSWKEPRRLCKEWLWGIVSLLPSVTASIYGGYPEHLFEKHYVPSVNPLSWNLSEATSYTDFPHWLVYSHFILSLGFLLLCLYCMKKYQSILPWFAPFLFVLGVRAGTLAQHWYFMLLPALCLPIEEKNVRRVFFVWCAVLGILSFHSIFIGPIGYQNPPDVMILLNKVFWGF